MNIKDIEDANILLEKIVEENKRILAEQTERLLSIADLLRNFKKEHSDFKPHLDIPIWLVDAVENKVAPKKWVNLTFLMDGSTRRGSIIHDSEEKANDATREIEEEVAHCINKGFHPIVFIESPDGAFLWSQRSHTIPIPLTHEE